MGGVEQTGRSLFVSLSVLRELDSPEATAVLAHEMAHFSGDDTVFSRRVSPLLARYDSYLFHLSGAATTVPVFHFMRCFRALFEISIGKNSRTREFRADRIASELTSPHAITAALLRVTAYSEYRRTIEEGMFGQEHVISNADIADRIDNGFQEFAAQTYSLLESLENLRTVHPFDSHPSLSQRAEALGVSLDPETCRGYLNNPADRRWYQLIDNAESMEKELWRQYESEFCNAHELSLAYRYLPSTAVEREVVARHFPEISFQGKHGALTIDHTMVQYSSWSRSVEWQDVFSCEMTDQGLEITTSDSRGTRTIRLKEFPDAEDVVARFQTYYGRYLAAKEGAS